MTYLKKACQIVTNNVIYLPDVTGDSGFGWDRYVGVEHVQNFLKAGIIDESKRAQTGCQPDVNEGT